MYELIPESRYKAFFAVIAVLIAAYLLRAALQYVVCYWGHIFGVLVEADIRQDLFTHLQSLSPSIMSRPPTEITATGMMQVKNSMEHINQLMAL